MTKAIFYITGLLFITGCSVLETRFYSAPSEHVKPIQKSSRNVSARLNPGLNRFDQTMLAKEFEDSVSHTLINLSLNNDYTRAVLGPPFIPVFPHKFGYGHPDNKKAVRDLENDHQLVLQLSIKIGVNDKMSFVPDSFYIKKSDRSMAKLVSVEGHPDNQVIEQAYSGDWVVYTLRFQPGAHVKDLPELYLTSLKINGKEFREKPIRFVIGKRSFYSPLISING